MTYRVTVSDGSTPSIKIKKDTRFKVSEALPVTRLQDLSDVNVGGVQNNYLLAYDSTTQSYKTINPDDILSAAVTDTNAVGIPTVFINQMATDLDNKVDLDAGEF